MKTLRNSVAALVRANEADSWKGGGDPADIPAITATYKEARAEYTRAIERHEAALRKAALFLKHVERVLRAQGQRVVQGESTISFTLADIKENTTLCAKANEVLNELTQLYKEVV